jgi:hypothetical protein
MTTHVLVDVERTDLRNYKKDVPFWVSSAMVDVILPTAVDDKGVVLFKFPLGATYILHNLILEIPTGGEITGGTTVMTIGSGTMATPDATDVVTLVDLDEYMATAQAVPGTAGTKFPAVAVDAMAAIAANTGWVITGADTTTPCVVAYVTSDAPITAGKFRVHMLVSKMPV